MHVLFSGHTHTHTHTQRKTNKREFPGVQWLGLWAFTAGLGSVPSRGTKIPQAAWRCQKNKQNPKKQKTLPLWSITISLDFSKSIMLQSSLRICTLGFLGVAFEYREDGSAGVGFNDPFHSSYQHWKLPFTHLSPPQEISSLGQGYCLP